MRLSNELQIGKAGEYITCADLIIKGFVAFPSEQGLPYDVLLDTGEKILRVQVKTTLTYRKTPQRNKESYSYVFGVKRAGKKNKKIFSKKDADLFALVCLDTMNVGYVKNEDMPSTIILRPDSLIGTYHDEKGIKDYQKAISMKGQYTQTEIAKRLNIHVAQVNRMFKDGYVPYKTRAKYFSSILRDKDWFLSL